MKTLVARLPSAVEESIWRKQSGWEARRSRRPELLSLRCGNSVTKTGNHASCDAEQLPRAGIPFDGGARGQRFCGEAVAARLK